MQKELRKTCSFATMGWFDIKESDNDNNHDNFMTLILFRDEVIANSKTDAILT